MAERNLKVISSLFGNNLAAPLLPKYAFNNAKQSFRFILQVSGLNVAFIQDVTRPSLNIDHKQYDYLGYTLNYPNKIKWNNVTFTVIESHDPELLGSVLGNLMQKVQTTAYSPPTLVNRDSFKNLSKKNLIADFGNIFIKTLDPDGQVVDTWKLYNPSIVKLTPSPLKYSDDNLTNISVELVYDWAEYYIGPDIVAGKLVTAGIEEVRSLFR